MGRLSGLKSASGFCDLKRHLLSQGQTVASRPSIKMSRYSPGRPVVCPGLLLSQPSRINDMSSRSHSCFKLEQSNGSQHSRNPNSGPSKPRISAPRIGPRIAASSGTSRRGPSCVGRGGGSRGGGRGGSGRDRRLGDHRPCRKGQRGDVAASVGAAEAPGPLHDVGGEVEAGRPELGNLVAVGVGPRGGRHLVARRDGRQA